MASPRTPLAVVTHKKLEQIMREKGYIRNDVRVQWNGEYIIEIYSDKSRNIEKSEERQRIIGGRKPIFNDIEIEKIKRMKAA